MLLPVYLGRIVVLWLAVAISQVSSLYARVNSSANCHAADGLKDVDSQAECELAAEYLGLGDRTADVFNFDLALAARCVFTAQGTGGLMFYSAATTAGAAPCGFNRLDCICKTQAAQSGFSAMKSFFFPTEPDQPTAKTPPPSTPLDALTTTTPSLLAVEFACLECAHQERRNSSSFLQGLRGQTNGQPNIRGAVMSRVCQPRPISIALAIVLGRCASALFE